MNIETYIRVELTGYVSKMPVKQKNSLGREYMRLVVGVPNPNIANAVQEWTYIECTIWDANVIKKMSASEAKKGDIVNLEGEFFIQSYKGRKYAKMFVRDYRVVSIKEDEMTPEKTLENVVQTFNENSNDDLEVKEEDYNTNF